MSPLFYPPPSLLTGSGDTASELLVSMGSGSNLEDFYPSVAINSLMKILKDQSLSQHHTMSIQALGFIFKSLGIKSVPYLTQVCGVCACVVCVWVGVYVCVCFSLWLQVHVGWHVLVANFDIT